MATTIAAILAGAGTLIGAGSSIYGASQQPEGVQAHEVPVVGYNPWSEPLLAALSMNAMTGVGGYDPGIYRAANPIAQLVSQARTSGTYNSRQLRYLDAAAGLSPEIMRGAAGLSGPDLKRYLRSHGVLNVRQAVRGLPLLQTVAGAAGYGSLGEIFTEQEQHMAQLEALRQQYEPVSQAMRRGILASQERVGGYLENLPNLLTGADNPFTRQLREEALTTAQRYGVNPYNLLEQADAVALQRALQLIGGEQAVVGTQQAGALPVAGMRQAGGINAANIGAQQAQMLASALQSQQIAQANQANAWMGAGNQLGGLGLILGDLLAGGGVGPAAGPRAGGFGGADTGPYIAPNTFG